jgi:hypothetical protein
MMLAAGGATVTTLLVARFVKVLLANSRTSYDPGGTAAGTVNVVLSELFPVPKIHATWLPSGAPTGVNASQSSAVACGTDCQDTVSVPPAATVAGAAVSPGAMTLIVEPIASRCIVSRANSRTS